MATAAQIAQIASVIRSEVAASYNDDDDAVYGMWEMHCYGQSAEFAAELAAALGI